MNSLSWFLYFADVLPKLGALASVTFGVTAFLGTIIILFINAMKADNALPKSFEDSVPKLNKLYFSVLLVSAFFSVMVPYKETIYMIAGSEAGEYVVNTPEAQEVLDSIKEVIQLQIEELKPNDSKPAN